MSCKVLMVIRALGYYLSSAILVNISIDRYGNSYLSLDNLLVRCLAVMKPLDTLQSCRQRRRARYVMVSC